MEHAVTTPFGRRPMTLAMLASQIASQDTAPDKTIDKWKLYRALCAARTRLGITDRALALVNALMSFYPRNELSPEHGLVVFPSNAQLSVRAHGMAEPTIRRHIAVLVEAGLIARKDSANGKRYARRGRAGEIDEAFGFSLAPLVARAEEIETLAAEAEAERIVLQRLRERLTICRRDVAKLIATAIEEGAPGDWEALHLEFRALVASIPRSPTAPQVTGCLDAMELLRDRIVNLLKRRIKAENHSGKPARNERHIQNSNPDSITESEPLPKKEQVARTEDDRQPGSEPIRSFPLGMVLRACPGIADYGPGGGISSWRDMSAAAVVVRSTLGISPSAYQEACEVMGPENAAVAVACMLERAGHINSAGGYLRDLTRKAARGEFSLGPMLMALLRANVAPVARTG